ncbi:MAG TPA: DUF4245 domain-containing protein [Micromonospora sp.]|nr:DUF4245 domain-containing protein [Micromonospora sp.]
MPPTEHVPGPPSPAGSDDSVAAPPAARSERSAKDMAMSLLILLLPVALLFAFHQVVLDGDEPAVIDPAPAVETARVAGTFPVSEPAGLDARWRPIRADFRREESGHTLRIGYVTPNDEGVQLVQSNVPADRLLPAELTKSSQPRGTVEVAGRSWQRYSARPGEWALVLLEPERTVIVVGSTGESELRQLAEKIG